MKIKLNEGAIFSSNNITDSGYDVCCLGYRDVNDCKLNEPEMLKEGEYITLFPHETVMILTGVYMELPEPKDCGDYMEIMEAQVRPRSGLSLKESKVAILGTVDNSYRGEIGVILNNTSDEQVSIQYKEKIAQIVLVPIRKYKNIEIVSELSETTRGANGFGSSGK